MKIHQLAIVAGICLLACGCKQQPSQITQTEVPNPLVTSSNSAPNVRVELDDSFDSGAFDSGSLEAMQESFVASMPQNLPLNRDTKEMYEHFTRVLYLQAAAKTTEWLKGTTNHYVVKIIMSTGDTPSVDVSINPKFPSQGGFPWKTLFWCATFAVLGIAGMKIFKSKSED